MGAAVAVTEFDALIEKISKRGYLWYQFGEDRHGPQVLAGVFQWPTCADVVVLTDDRDSHAYRTPRSIPDVFAPARVHWWYGRSDSTVRQLGTGLPGVSMVWVLRALLTLPRPDQPYGLLPLRPAPPGTGVPGGTGDRVPVRMRRWMGR
jgi:hypothetical protein